MPKTCLTPGDRLADRAATADDALRLTVATRMMRDRRTQKDIAQCIGITPITFSRRLANPEGFTLIELRRMFTELCFSDAEIKKCIGGVLT